MGVPAVSGTSLPLASTMGGLRQGGMSRERQFGRAVAVTAATALWRAQVVAAHRARQCNWEVPETSSPRTSRWPPPIGIAARLQPREQVACTFVEAHLRACRKRACRPQTHMQAGSASQRW